ncbi:MAG: TetR/AcrR family transcriptional regulator [Pirellulaceae bacterium]|nr:TetR/AcrR family transcriptional regulator [Pirellulaceae bacterium]
MPRLTERRKAAVDAAMRDGLFEAAVAVIAQHGSAGLTMERLAIAARVAKGSVYNYFRSKRGLLQFVYQKAYEPISVQMHEIAASGQTARDKLEAMARMYFEHVNQERELFAFLLNDATVRGLLKTEQDSLRAQVIGVLTGIIEQGTAAGEFRPLDAKPVAEMVLGAIRQLAEKSVLRRKRQCRVREVDHVGAIQEVWRDDCDR